MRRGPVARTVRSVLTLIWLGLVITAAAAFASRYATVLPKPRYAVALTAFSPYVMLCAPAAMLLTLGARRWRLAFVAGLLTVAVVVVELPIFIPNHSTERGPVIHVLTANLKLGQANPTDVVAAVRAGDVSVLMTQELSHPETDALVAAGIKTLLPYSQLDVINGSSGTGLWSRYPLTDQRTYSNFRFGTVSARLRIPGVAGEPLAIAAHMPGPWNARPTAWMQDIAALPGLLAESAATVGKEGSVILGADLNATYDSRQFRRCLAGGYRDAAEQSGAGITATFPAQGRYPPLIAIDHVLSRNAQATSVRAVTISGSDHRALLVSMRLPAG
jgi:endonuclease/exonuclease/phosphatase (EEP) superfamily protein YafD